MQKAYENYRPADYLKDEDFLRWRLLRRKEDEQLWHAFLKEHPEQQAAVDEAIRRAEGIKLNNYACSNAEKQILWKHIRRRVNKQRTARLWRFAASIAACAALLAGLLWTVDHPHSCPDIKDNTRIDSLLQEKHISLILADGSILPVADGSSLQYNTMGLSLKTASQQQSLHTGDQDMHTLIVPHGKTFFLSFEDGTCAWINSETVIDYPAHFQKHKREMHVKGEVYMEVNRNRHVPFIVHTCRFDIHVLGTKFNVSAYKEEKRHSVVLAQGNVKICSDRLDTPVCLKPNEMFSAETDSCTTTQVNAYDYICWKDGMLSVKSEPLSAIARKLSRHYDTDIRLENSIRHLKCSGKIVLFDELDTTLRNITHALPVTFEHHGDSILISRKPSY